AFCCKTFGYTVLGSLIFMTMSSLALHKPEWLTSMKTILEVLNESIIITDENQQILFTNSHFIEMTSIPKQDLIGNTASRFYTSHDWDFLTTQIDTAFRQKHNRYQFFLPKKAENRLPIIIN